MGLDVVKVLLFVVMLLLQHADSVTLQDRGGREREREGGEREQYVRDKAINKAIIAETRQLQCLLRA